MNSIIIIIIIALIIELRVSPMQHVFFFFFFKLDFTLRTIVYMSENMNMQCVAEYAPVAEYAEIQLRLNQVEKPQ